MILALGSDCMQEFVLTGLGGGGGGGGGSDPFLQNTKQYVYLNDHSSSIKEINYGVPQGSILGPLLFIVYINDFHRSSDILSFILFADDSNVFFAHKNPYTGP